MVVELADRTVKLIVNVIETKKKNYKIDCTQQMYMYEQIKQKHGYVFLDLIVILSSSKNVTRGSWYQKGKVRLAALEGRVRWD